MTPLRSAKLLHTVVAMGVALTGGSVTACGGSTEGSPLAIDAGADSPYATIRPAPEPDGGYVTIGYAPSDAGVVDAYPTIGIYQPDGGPDGYPIILPAYPPDAGPDAYGTIKSPPPDGGGAIDAAGDATYPTIGIAHDGG